MHYLTVQDVIWIHLQITKKKDPFNFATLEEATSYQYAYGKSRDVLSQAARYFSGFVTKNPFESGNEAVAFTSGIVFLELNGLQFNPKEKDLVAWFERATNLATTKEAIEEATSQAHGDHHATSRAVAESVIERYTTTIKKLLE